MRLTRKLTLAVSLVVLLVLSSMAALAWRREVQLFDADMRHDARIMAAALAQAAAHAWKQEGERAARALVENAPAGDDDMRIRLVRLDAPAQSGQAPMHAGSARAALTQARIVTWRESPRPGAAAGWSDSPGHGHGALYTYAPVASPSGEAAALELSESLAAEQAYVRTSLWRTAFGAGVLSLLVAALLSALGSWLIGRPVAALGEKARRVGAGDLTTPLKLRQRDELGHLAEEMNLMGHRLAEEIAARQSATEQLRHADRLTTAGKLASGLAHELGTPLNVVAAWAHQIAEGEVAGADLVEGARAIEEQSERMTRLIEELLGFARPRPPERRTVALDHVIRHTVDLLAPMASKTGVAVEASELAAIRTEADAGQLQQVLTNLIVNALQATPEGGRVSVGAELARTTPPPDRGGAPASLWVRLWVRDTGAGMDESTARRIFEPFFTTKDVGRGTGLGLSISYGIVREHGGWIDVQTAPGRGSTFSVWLPA